MTHYFDLANSGEHVEVKSRSGSFRLTPLQPRKAKRQSKPKRDVTAEVCQALKDWKEFLETGKSDKFLPAEELINELRDN